MAAFVFFMVPIYTLKPFLVVALRSSLFKPGAFDVTIEEHRIELKDEEATINVLFSSFERIARQPPYYAIKLPGKMTFYLRASQLTYEETAILDNHLTSK